MIQMRSQMNSHSNQQNLGLGLLNNIAESNRRGQMIYAFTVIKVLFEYKNQVDHEIKINSRMTVIRSNVNHKIAKNGRIRRRFIRHKDDFIFKDILSQSQLGDEVEGEAGAADVVGGANHVILTTGINNYLIGNNAISRVRDRHYFEEEGHIDEEGEGDSKMAYPVMKQGLGGEEHMIVHSNLDLKNRFMAHQANFDARGAGADGSSEFKTGASSIWDIKQARLGGRSRGQIINNGIFSNGAHSHAHGSSHGFGYMSGGGASGSGEMKMSTAVGLGAMILR